MILVIDFETVDPYIKLKMGTGWVYGIVNPSSKFKIVGASMKEAGSQTDPVFETDWRAIVERVLSAEGLVMHNAQYDFGCLLRISNEHEHELLYKKDIYDTRVMAILDNSARPFYTLDYLAKEILGKEKNTSILLEAAHTNNLKPWTDGELKQKKKAQKEGKEYVRKRPKDDVLERLAMSNLDRIPRDIVADYCNHDVKLTEELYMRFLQRIKQDATNRMIHRSQQGGTGLYTFEQNLINSQKDMIRKYSGLAKICCKNRLRGVPIDIEKLKENSKLLESIIQKQEEELYELSNINFNLRSPTQTAEVLKNAGVSCPTTEKGNLSASTPWLSTQKEPICKAIMLARQSYKIGHDFLDGVSNKLLMTDGHNLYPELNILQAKTGRFSSTGPNIQQIPSDDVYGKICRGIYYKGQDENVLFHSLDYSNQEGRLQLHYAIVLKCSGADKIAIKAQNPNWDMHLDIAKMIWGESVIKNSPERESAKQVNHSLSYGMGRTELMHRLGMSKEETADLIKQYYKAAPYLKELINITKNAMLTRGFIKTISGRKLLIDPPKDNRTFEYRALNKLIQGSAAEQTIAAMVQADLKGLPVLFPVHDELTMIGTMEQANLLKHIMETCIKLEVPVVVSITSGNSWG